MKFQAHIEDVPAWGGPVAVLSGRDAVSGEEALARVALHDGCNLFSFIVDGRDYLWAEGDPGAANGLFGTPILYPTPNRVKNAAFDFEGRRFDFPRNSGPNSIHGLVRRAPWEFQAPMANEEGAWVDASISFEEGDEKFRLFPIRHTLSLRIHLKKNAVRLDFRVENRDEHSRLPFGLAIHPYFPVIGERSAVRLQVPAAKWMESKDCLPSGRLVNLADGPADLREPAPLAGLNLDDVFWGMSPDRPAIIYYDQIGKKLTLAASDFFTHIVIYTPVGKSFFCVENQSCSTDAHNLHARGLIEEAHLAVLEPGESQTACVEMRVEDQ